MEVAVFLGTNFVDVDSRSLVEDVSNLVFFSMLLSALPIAFRLDNKESFFFLSVMIKESPPKE